MKRIGKLGILGDSYSTFGGYVPTGYAVYYNYDSGEDRGFVNNVDLTWWMQVVRAEGGELAMNSSYSGSCVCNFSRGKDVSEASFTTRMKLDLGSDMALDTILIYGCTNDVWKNVSRGEVNFGEVSKEELNSLYPAICHMVGFLRNVHPNARIVFMTNWFFDEELTGVVQSVCDHFGAEHLYIQKVDTVNDHPTVRGMKQIADQVIAHLQK